MPKRTSRKIPSGATVLRTYDSLFGELDAFAHGERNLVTIVGPPGTARHHLKQARFIEGGSTPYRLYIECYENRNCPIVLDDADKVFRHRDGVFLLKLLTQTTPEKTLQWNSNTAEIRAGELPAEFSTTSRVLILANSWPQENPDIAAIESRGHLLYFVPSFAELHRYAATYFKDAEVHGYIGQHLQWFDEVDLRLYHKAQEIKVTGLRTGDTEGWKEYVQGQMMDAEKRIALDLMLDGSFASDNQRAKEFRRITGMSERAFYRYRDDIVQRQPDLVRSRMRCQRVRGMASLTL